jgi:hypothetical protein
MTLGVAGVEAESSQRAVRGHGERQQAAHPPCCSLGPEIWPAGVGTELVGVKGQLVRDGVEAGSLAGAELKGIDLGHNRSRAHRSSDRVFLEEERAGELTGLDGENGEIHRPCQGLFDAVGQEQAPGDFSEGGGRRNGGVLDNTGLLSGGVHGASLSRSPRCIASHQEDTQVFRCQLAAEV